MAKASLVLVQSWTVKIQRGQILISRSFEKLLIFIMLIQEQSNSNATSLLKFSITPKQFNNSVSVFYSKAYGRFGIKRI